MVNRQSRATRRQRRGAALVEFAITAPIIFAIFFAGFEFCRMNIVRHSIDNAAYEGARRAIIPGATANDAVEAATPVLAVVSIRNPEITVDPPVISTTTEAVTVTIAVPYNSNSWVPPLFFRDKVLTGTCTLTREQMGR